MLSYYASLSVLKKANYNKEIANRITSRILSEITSYNSTSNIQEILGSLASALVKDSYGSSLLRRPSQESRHNVWLARRRPHMIGAL